MYVHAKIFIYDKVILEQAIKSAFKQPLSSLVSIVIDRYGNEDVLLTERRLELIKQENIIRIACDKDQIMNHAHSCISTETLKKILV